MAEPADPDATGGLDLGGVSFEPAFPSRANGRRVLPAAPRAVCPFACDGRHGEQGSSCPWRRVTFEEAYEGWHDLLPWLTGVRRNGGAAETGGAAP